MTEPCSDTAMKPTANMSKGKQKKTKDSEVKTERSGHEKKNKGILSQLDKARAKRARQKRRKTAREKARTKDPEEASSYLAAWKAHQDLGTAWRFNKATQAWLLRHAYEPELVPKKVFQLLLRYLAGLSGAARDRAVAEAGALVTLQGAEVPKAGATQSKPARQKRSRKPKESAANEKTAPDIVEPEDATDRADEEEAKKRKARLARARKVLEVLERENS